jgi:excinuclease ABC subunit A
MVENHASADGIRLRGIREAGLDGIDLHVPLRRIVRLCGSAGCGAEAVAVRVLLGESRRRYLLSLTPFERERIGGIGIQAAVDGIDRLPPAQPLPAPATASATVASRLHLHAELVRVMQARAQVLCPQCQGLCVAFHEDDIARLVEERFASESILVIAPMKLAQAATPGVMGELSRAGFRRVRIDGSVLRIEAVVADESLGATATMEGVLQVVVDRLSPSGRTRSRLGEAVRTARAIATGRTLLVGDAGQEVWVDSRRACLDCGELVTEPEWDDLARGITTAPLVLINDEPCTDLLADLRLGDMARLLGDLEDGPARRLRRIAEVCREFALGQMPLWRMLRDLAHGEQLLLGIAGTLVMGLTGVLHVVLSPPSALDQATRRLVYQGLRRLVNDGSSVVVLDAGQGEQDAVDETITIGSIQAVDAVTASSASKRALLNEAEHLVVTPATAGDLRVPVHRLVLPLGQLVAVVGSTGSGKSRLLRLIHEGLSAKGSSHRHVQAPSVRRVIDVSADEPKRGARLADLLAVHRPLARVFADSPVARESHLSVDHFLLEKPGGRCTQCEGQGVIRHELDMVEDVEVICSRCDGRRFRDEVLAVTAHGVSIAEVCGMSVAEAGSHFARERSVKDALGAAALCGLGSCRLDSALRDLDAVERLLGRVARSQITLRRGDLVLADRPFAGCDQAATVCLLNSLRRLVTAGASAIVTDTDRALVDHVDTVIVLEVAPDAGPGTVLS